MTVMVGARVEALGLDPWRLQAEAWGWFAGSRLEGLCVSGANLVPVAGPPEALVAFADRARRQGRRCSSIVGDAWLVAALWEQLEAAWGPAREVRPRQPVLVADALPAVPADPDVRVVRPDEVDVLLPAAVAMFTEEIGVSPLHGDGGQAYRARLEQIVGQRRALARIDEGRVVFKAEIGAVSRLACQVQGVWVDPQWRGRGLGTHGMAAVVAHALELAPCVTLYVNDYNLPARAAYERVGFTQAGTFASVLF